MKPEITRSNLLSVSFKAGWLKNAPLTLALGSMTSINLLIAFLLQAYVLTSLGASVGTDALFAGMILPQFLVIVVSASLQYVFLPLLSVESGLSFRRIAWSTFAGLLLLFGSLSLLLSLTSHLWVPLLVAGFSEEAQRLTLTLTRIQLIGMVFTGANALLWSANRARNRFLLVEGTRMVSFATALILLILFLGVKGIEFAAWVFVLKEALQTVILLPGLGRPVRPDFRDPVFRTAGRRIGPLLLGTSYNKTDALVDRALASFAAVGSLSLLHFAQLIINSGAQVLNNAIVVPVMPDLSRHYKDGEHDRFRRRVRRRMLVIAVLVAAGLAFLAVAGGPLLGLLAGVGSFDAESIVRLHTLLMLMGGMLVGATLAQILVSAFYASGDTRTPVTIGMITYTISIPLRIVAFLQLGLMGLAAAISFHYLLSLLLIATYARRRGLV